MKNKLAKMWEKEEKIIFEGWDFTYLQNRKIDEKLPWNYTSMAKRLVRKSESVLDMGTGGGEIFSSLAPFPGNAFATEGWKPNLSIARKRLRPLGVKVVYVKDKKLPFDKESFDTVLNRHEAFDAKEVFRVLKKNGVFLTQQVGGGNLRDLTKALNADTGYKKWSLRSLTRDVKNAGLKVKFAKEWSGKTEFKDVGAIVYFLKAVPWVVGNFTVKKYFSHLEKLQRRLNKGEKLIFTEVKFLVMAKKH